MKISKIIPVLLIGTCACAQMFCCRYKTETTPPIPENITFIGDGPQGVYEQSTDVWSPVTVDAAYNHLGLADCYLPEGQDGYIMADVNDAAEGPDNGSYFLGYNYQNTQDVHDDAAIMVRPVVGSGFQIWVGASYEGIIGSVSDGNKFRIRISRSLSKAFVEKSTDGVSWASVFETSGFDYGNLYPVTEIYGNAAMHNPLQSGHSRSILDGNSGDDATRPVLIVKWGESNSGGRALDADAYSYEIAQRNKLKIFHNYEGVFQRLDIGVNNRIGHAGTGDWGNRHGIELQISNRQEEGTFISTTDTVYMLAVGQGGTTVDNWAYGGNTVYESINPWDTAVQRMDAALALLEAQTGKEPRVFMFYSQGLNDLFNATNTAAQWKTKTLAVIDSIRVHWGVFPIVMTKFFDDYTGYNTVMDEIAAERSQVYVIETEWDSLGDLLHYDYDGMKALGNDFINKLLEHYNF